MERINGGDVMNDWRKRTEEMVMEQNMEWWGEEEIYHRQADPEASMKKESDQR
jgi:hypothetical protein